MDPARVDGLARVLESASADRQVVVFTHDDRLPEAVRRLDIAAEILEVTRREGSVVELRRSLDPVGRYLEDAIAVAGTAGLPSSAAAHVVPGLCRLALEAVCMEVVRRRRLLRGEAHAEVERILSEAGRPRPGSPRSPSSTTSSAARRCSSGSSARQERPLADAFRRCDEGGEMPPADAVDLVRLASQLTAWFRGLE